MQKRIRRIIAVFLTLVLTFAVCPLTLSAVATVSTGTCGSGVKWSYDSETGVLTLSGTGAMSSAYTTAARPGYNSYKSGITSIVVGEGITSLGNYAFYNLTKAASVSLPSTLITIEDRAFEIVARHLKALYCQSQSLLWGLTHSLAVARLKP